MRIEIRGRACTVILVSLLTGCLSASGTSSAAVEKIIKIGVDLPLSATDGVAGHNALTGIQLAIDEANKEGLPGGFVLQADVLDDVANGLHDPKKGAANVAALVADPGVLALIGPINSNVAQAEIPLTNAAGLAEISSVVTNDGLTLGAQAAALRQGNPTQISFFRICSNDAHQGVAGAFFAVSRQYYKAFVIDDGETYGVGLANAFSMEYRNSGGVILGRARVPKNVTGVKALLAKIAAAKPDVIFYGGLTSTGGALIRANMADGAAKGIAFMGGAGISDLSTIDGAKVAEATLYTLPFADAQKLPNAAAYRASYDAAYHQPIGTFSAGAFAATQVVIAALKRAIMANNDALPTRAQVLAQV